MRFAPYAVFKVRRLGRLPYCKTLDHHQQSLTQYETATLLMLHSSNISNANQLLLDMQLFLCYIIRVDKTTLLNETV